MNESGMNSPEALQLNIEAKEHVIKDLDNAIEELNDTMKVIPSEKRVVHNALWNHSWKLRNERADQIEMLESMKSRIRAIEKEEGSSCESFARVGTR
ncbi:hypothetical protein [Cohnella sp.]|uniref:hypothetical protein n=1 Tax=Cohnella sp. TaxID=1883426 RepID=UPI003703D002